MTGKFPVTVFNHGYLSYLAQHTALFEHLAANGCVVLSVGHPWESGGIVYPNGDAVVGSPRILQDMMQIGQALGAMAALAPTHTLDKYPPPLFFIFGSVALLLAAFDVRMIARGGVTHHTPNAASVANVSRHVHGDGVVVPRPAEGVPDGSAA